MRNTAPALSGVFWGYGAGKRDMVLPQWNKWMYDLYMSKWYLIFSK